MSEHDDELRARIERLQEALLTVAWMYEREKRKDSPYYPRLLGSIGQQELGLRPGDVDPARQYPLEDEVTA